MKKMRITGGAEMEKCIVCRQEVDVPAELDISCRNDYVEGLGQLCAECGERFSRRGSHVSLSRTIAHKI